MAKRRVGKSEIASKAESALQEEANRLFKKALEQGKNLKQSIVELGETASKLRRNGLWKHVTDSKGRPRFQQWTDVGVAVLGPMAKRTMYHLVSAFELTQGAIRFPLKKCAGWDQLAPPKLHDWNQRIGPRTSLRQP